MNERKLLNILIWIPLIGILIVFYDFHKSIRNPDTWFNNTPMILIMANGLYHGLATQLVLFLITGDVLFS